MVSKRSRSLLINIREAHLILLEFTNHPVCADKERDLFIEAQPPFLEKEGNELASTAFSPRQQLFERRTTRPTRISPGRPISRQSWLCTCTPFRASLTGAREYVESGHEPAILPEITCAPAFSCIWS